MTTQDCAGIGPASPIGVGRKDQVLGFIRDYLLTRGSSPSMPQIATHFGFSRQRAKAIVDMLVADKLIHRAPGSQRAISVPGLQREQLIAALRRHGVTVDDDFNAFDAVLPLPQGNLPLVAIIEHIPDVGDRLDEDRRHAG